MRYGWIHFDGWAGRTRHKVEILRQGPKRYTVRLLGRAYRHAAGAILRPPVWAVTLGKEQPR